MSDERLHRAVSDDGTQIVGTVHGDGPPLVLISGTGDGKLNPFLLPSLAEGFTCYSMSLRSRGLSGEHPDHSPDRLVEDVAAFVDSIGGPVGLAGHSRGAAIALSAAARSSEVVGLAVYEPHVIEFYRDDDVARVNDALLRMEGARAEDRLADAAGIFFEDITLPGEGELEVLAGSGAFDFVAPLMPAVIQDLAGWQLPRSRDTVPLGQISAPVLLLHGSRTHPFYREVVRQLAGRLSAPEVVEIPDVGHFGSTLAPEGVAAEVATFFSANSGPA